MEVCAAHLCLEPITNNTDMVFRSSSEYCIWNGFKILLHMYTFVKYILDFNVLWKLLIFISSFLICTACLAGWLAVMNSDRPFKWTHPYTDHHLSHHYYRHHHRRRNHHYHRHHHQPSLSASLPLALSSSSWWVVSSIELIRNTAQCPSSSSPQTLQIT